MRDPRAEIVKLLDFAGLAMDARLEDYLSKPLPLSKHTQTQARSGQVEAECDGDRAGDAAARGHREATP